MNSHSASATSSTEPPHRTVQRLSRSCLRSASLVLCPAALAATPATTAFAGPVSRNFIQLASTNASTSNFVVIRSFAKGALTSTAEAAPERAGLPARGPSERVELDSGVLSAFVNAHKLALRPVFLHFSAAASAKERQSVVGLRGNEVWRYDLGGATPSRRISRLGISVPLSDALRAEHESAVVDAKVVLAYQPTIDLPNGDAAAEAGAPVYSFVRNGKALYQVNRSGEGSFTITQIGVLEDAD